MRYLLGTAEIDPTRREVLREGTVVDVEPKVFDLIVFLVENTDRVVSKDDLIKAVWDGRAIADTTLSTCVKAARRALGDNGRDQRMIRTLHGHGFRFVGPFRIDTDELQSPAVTPSDDARPVNQGKQNHGLDLSLPGRPSIAVLPFSTLDKGCREQQLLAGGLLHDLTVRLARTRWLFVSARASAERFRMTTDGAEAIGRALGVRYLLHGSVIRSADRFRLTVALSDALQGCEIWAERFDRKLHELFAVQDEIADLVVAAVESEIELKERQRAMLRPLATLDAWTAYHQATHHLYRFSPDAHDQAERLFHLAAEADPGSSRVFAGLSFLHWQRAFFESSGHRERSIDRAADYAEQSLSLDPIDPQAHWVSGRAAMLRGDLDLAVDELSTAVELNPSHARGHFSLGYGKLFRKPEADVVDDAAAARRISPYDPMSFAYLCLLAEANVFLGHHDEAIAWARRAVRPRNAHYHIHAVAAWCLEAAGDHDAARAQAREVRQRRPDYSRAAFFRAYPYQEPQRRLVDGALKRLGF